MDGSRPGRWRDSHLIGVTSGSELSLIIKADSGWTPYDWESNQKTVSAVPKALLARQNAGGLEVPGPFSQSVRKQGANLFSPTRTPVRWIRFPIHGRSDADWPPLSANLEFP